MNFKKSVYTKKTISAALIAAMLFGFMLKAQSSKIIFVPFIICACAVFSENIALLFEKKAAELFDKLFSVGFLLFFSGFIILALFVSIRDKNNSLLIATLPFLIFGIYLLRKRLFKNKPKKYMSMHFIIAVSAFLVIAVLIIGIIMLFLGIKDRNFIITLFGAFFFFGGAAFVLAVLKIKGCFDKFKVDVLGIYMGGFIAITGIVTIALKYAENGSLKIPLRISDFGFWILVPIIMISVGVFAVIKFIIDGNKR